LRDLVSGPCCPARSRMQVEVRRRSAPREPCDREGVESSAAASVISNGRSAVRLAARCCLGCGTSAVSIHHVQVVLSVPGEQMRFNQGNASTTRGQRCPRSSRSNVQRRGRSPSAVQSLRARCTCNHSLGFAGEIRECCIHGPPPQSKASLRACKPSAIAAQSRAHRELATASGRAAAFFERPIDAFRDRRAHARPTCRTPRRPGHRVGRRDSRRGGARASLVRTRHPDRQPQPHPSAGAISRRSSRP